MSTHIAVLPDDTELRLRVIAVAAQRQAIRAMRRVEKLTARAHILDDTPLRDHILDDAVTEHGDADRWLDLAEYAVRALITVRERRRREADLARLETLHRNALGDDAFDHLDVA